MNIHEYQSKEILRKYGAPVSNGIVINNPSELKSKISNLFLSGFFILIFAPFLGALADITFRKKYMLVFFMLIGAGSTASFFFINEGYWMIAVITYILASIGFSGGNIFYDSLIIDVSNDQSRNKVSAFGYAMGYLGGGILFVVNVLMYLQPNTFGLTSQIDAVLFSFLSVAIWWSVFTLPLIRFVKESKGEITSLSLISTLKNTFSRVINTFKEIRQYKNIFYFLLAYWLYMDGIDTVVRMALAFGSDIGLASSELIVALIITQFIGFPSTIFFGLLAERFGLKILLYLFFTVKDCTVEISISASLQLFFFSFQMTAL